MTAYSSKEIEKRVAEARSGGWTRLGLSHCGVQDDDILKLLSEEGVEQLQELVLYGNQLSALPPEIGKLTALTGLVLAENQLSVLPLEIGKLTALTGLYLSGNQISTIPPEIGKLTALKELSLDGNQLSTLPPEIWNLTVLRMLDLSRNQLSTLPPEFGKLTALTSLYLTNNRLSALPPEIGNLTALKELYLGGNQLSTLPPEIGKLTALTELYLYGNQLSALPPEFGKLTALTGLYLGKNRLSTLPPEIRNLTVLRMLDLSGNQLSTLPPEFGKLTALECLFLHGNDGLGIPPEILGPTWGEVRRDKRPAAPSAILDYYFRTRAASERRALNEVKVILVGQGSVGKTSLVKKIVYNKFNKREKKTEGIYIEKAWNVLGKKKGEKVQVNFWDFGGQDIMHATHQFFLTKRTIYLLVLDARKGENESNIHYWLKIISTYGADAPVLIVTNKCEAHHLDLNETRLRKDYPNIKGFFKTSCEDGTGVEALKRAIREQIKSNEMHHIFDPVPKEYFIVKEKLETRSRRDNYISMKDYRVICTDNGVSNEGEQDRLLRFLHDLGSVLSFNDPENPYSLREMSVLNPNWVTKGVYKILNSRRVAERRGELTKADLPNILKNRTHPPECHHFIIDMMHKFELCFSIKSREKWLVAELLPKNEPDVNWPYSSSLNFHYHYEVLPPGIICRFIVIRYLNLTDKPTYWHSGVVLEIEGCKVLVRSDSDKGRMFISVSGPKTRRRSALAVVRDEFRRIHATVPKLEPQEMVPLPDDVNITVPYTYLLELEERRRGEFDWPGVRESQSVQKLLDGIEDPMDREKPKGRTYALTTEGLIDVVKPPGEVFISYAHKDLKWQDELMVMLAPPLRGKVLDIWHDGKIKPSQDWRLEIEAALRRASVGVLLVSKHFLCSDFINNEELPFLIDAAKKAKVKLSWLLIGECMWDNQQFAKLQALHEIATPITALRGNNRDKVLKKIAQGIVNLVR